MIVLPVSTSSRMTLSPTALIRVVRLACSSGLRSIGVISSEPAQVSTVRSPVSASAALRGGTQGRQRSLRFLFALAILLRHVEDAVRATLSLSRAGDDLVVAVLLDVDRPFEDGLVDVLVLGRLPPGWPAPRRRVLAAAARRARALRDGPCRSDHRCRASRLLSSGPGRLAA